MVTGHRLSNFLDSAVAQYILIHYSMPSADVGGHKQCCQLLRNEFSVEKNTT